MTKYRTVDISSFVARHVYESYFNCDYDGPTWTHNHSLDLKIIAAMPVLYPEPIKETGRGDGWQISFVTPVTMQQESIPEPVSLPPQCLQTKAA